MVLQGKMDPTLLETYNEERLENAKHLLQTTDRMFQFAAGSEWFLAFLRTNVAAPGKICFQFRSGQEIRLPANFANRHQLSAQFT